MGNYCVDIIGEKEATVCFDQPEVTIEEIIEKLNDVPKDVKFTLIRRSSLSNTSKILLTEDIKLEITDTGTDS